MTAELRVERDAAQLIAGDLSVRLDLQRGARVVALEHAALPGANLIARWWCGYAADGRWWSDAPLPDEHAFAVDRARVRRGRRPEVVAQAVSPHLRVLKRFTVYPELPFIRVRYRLETTGVDGKGPGLSLGMPAVQFSDRLADPFDLLEDTADDGFDLGDGLALPAWRVFADPSGAYGLVAFAAARTTMSRLQLTERGCAFRPSYYLAYSTEVVTTRELRLGLQYNNVGPVDEVDWFIGAYQREALLELRRRIAGFHARRRNGGRREILEISPAARDAILPPPDALPPPWPVEVTLAPGDGATRYYVLPDESAAWSRVEVRSRHLTAVAQPEHGAPGTAVLRITTDPAAPTGIHRVSVPLPSGRLSLNASIQPRTPFPSRERLEHAAVRHDGGPASPGGAAAPPPSTSAEQDVVIGAAILAGRAATAGWHVVQTPAVPGGCALLVRPPTGAGATAEPLRIDPGLGGSYDIYAGMARGVGLKVRLDGDPYWTYLTADPAIDVQNWQPVESVLRDATEARIRRATLDDRGLHVAPHPNVAGYTVLTHLRFVPAPPPDPMPALAGRAQFVAGLADTPDVSFELAADSFHEDAWRESLWQHAVHGIDTVYWRIDGQCSDFHTHIGTRRYSVPRTHSLYSPISRYFGLALERLDPLRIAVSEARRWGLRLFGWMRTNNYSGNAVARFFVEHPEWHEEREDGSPAPQLCFAFSEVRAHKIAILREAAAYGLDGLMIDTLRHPPMVGYAPAVVDAFRARYGEGPPRESETTLPLARTDNRTGERWERWFRFRAEYFTQFLRELRTDLAVDGLGALPVHLRVAPRRFLHDGADLDALLDERLIDGIVANRYWTEPLDYEVLFPIVRGRVPICAICDPLRNDPIELLPQLQRDTRLAGIGLYESEWSVHTPAHREVLLQLARGPAQPAAR